MEGKAIEITIRTPSRLHFGMVDMRGDLGRLYGSIGVAIDKPNVILNAFNSSNLIIRGPGAERAKKFAATILETFEVDGGANIEITSNIKEHSGFGSGTQLALAVGTAISKLHGLKLSPEDIAGCLGRSRRSGVGVYAYKYGGFIIDGGHAINKKEKLPPLLFHTKVPRDWNFVVGLPDIPQKHHGAIENEAFDKMQPPPEKLVGEISRIILVQMMPAIIEKDIKAFGRAITAIDFKFGKFWLKVQGGRFSSPIIEDGVNFLLKAGALGVGQSSWGPAFYGLSYGDTQSNALFNKLDEYFGENGIQGYVFIAKPENKGARITVQI